MSFVVSFSLDQSTNLSSGNGLNGRTPGDICCNFTCIANYGSSLVLENDPTVHFPMVAYFCHEIRDSFRDNFREISL